MITIRNTTALLPFVMVLFAGAAAAEDRHSVKVSYAGLDLMSTAGSAEFERRINRGVRLVCAEGDYDRLDLGSLRRCRSETRARAQIEQKRVIADARQLAGRHVLASR